MSNEIPNDIEVLFSKWLLLQETLRDEKVAKHYKAEAQQRANEIEQYLAGEGFEIGPKKLNRI